MHPLDLSRILSPAQLAGYLAFVLGVSAFLQRDDRRLKLLLSAECLVYVVHFGLLGNTSASVSAGVNCGRVLLSLRYRSRRLAMAFVALSLALGAAVVRAPTGWIPVAASCVGAWGLLTAQGIRMRLFALVSTFLWIVNNVLSGSIGGTALEALIAAASISTMVRMARGAATSASPRPAATPPAR
jgi:hypothetical protein